MINFVKIRIMLKSLPIISFLLCTLFAQAQNYAVSDPIDVSPTLGFYHPQIEVASDGEPVILWTDASKMDIYLAKYDGIGAFPAPLKLNPKNVQVQSYNWSGPDLSIDGNNIYVVFKEEGYETGAIYLVKSSDNGISFGDTVRVDKPSFGYGQYPDVSVHQDTVYVTYMNHDHTNMIPQYVVSRSIDGGKTFDNPAVAGELLEGEACDCCQPELVTNEDLVILFLRNNDNNIRDIKGVVSYDRGLTFKDSLEVDKHQWMITQCPSTGPDARFLSKDTVLTVYKTSVSGKSKVFLNAYDLANGESMSTVQLSSDTDNSPNYPQLAIEGNVIGVVWEGFANSTDVFFNFSLNGLKDFNAANRYQLTASSGPQSKPDIAYANGIFHIVYSDYQGGNKYVQISNMVGLEELNANTNSVVYPNPVSLSTHKTVNFSDEVDHIEIFTTTGQLVFSNIESTSVLNVPTLSPGTYILKYHNTRNIHSELLLVQP
jgi:hypothetical protein